MFKASITLLTGITRGTFWILFYILYSTCFICRPSDSTVLEDAGIEPRTGVSCDFGIGKSDAQTTRLDLIHNSARSHPLSPRSHPPRLDLIHLSRSHPHRLDLIHNRLDLIPNRLDLVHSARSHPQLHY
jgi:hypothetical protein